MTADWRFYKQVSTDTIRNPISGEFFSSEAVGNAAEAIVREGIQNSLDARLSEHDGPASVRILVSGLERALPAEKAHRWFAKLWDHVMAPGNGLRSQPELHSACPFMVIEDFGTTGLTGAYDAHQVLPATTNHFLNFFRAEGHSDKGGHDRGSWGVGKTVFPRASQISTFLGMTVRADDHKRLLLGRSILKFHTVNGQSYKSDGYYGRTRDADEFMLPCEDAAVLDEFANDFQLKRKYESGLSLVVPWCDGDLTRDNILRAVLYGFFYPILLGDLSVTVAFPGGEIALDSSSIEKKVEEQDGAFKSQLLPLVRLAEWAKTLLEQEFISLAAPDAHRAQKWSADLLTESAKAHIRSSLIERRRVAVRVPLTVQVQAGELQSTFFNVFLEHSEHSDGKPVFIRDELIISDVRSRRVPQVRTIVIVEDEALATLLRDAETPAHTQWTQTTANFKDKYKFGPGVIRFVSQSVSELLRIVNQGNQNPDASLTVDFFSIPSPPEDEEAVPVRRKAKRTTGNEPDTPVPVPPAKPRRFRIDPLYGGFRITCGHPDAELPGCLRIRAAYDIRSGNPFKRYNPMDFDLGTPPIEYSVLNESVDVLTAAGQQMRILVRKPDFRIDVTGFDPDRDIKVEVRVVEEGDADKAG